VSSKPVHGELYSIQHYVINFVSDLQQVSGCLRLKITNNLFHYKTFMVILQVLFQYWWFMVLNATFNNISVISWQSVLLVDETGVPVDNHWPVASHWQSWSHNVVSSSLGSHTFLDFYKPITDEAQVSNIFFLNRYEC
jgi:hypothetical protein